MPGKAACVIISEKHNDILQEFLRATTVSVRLQQSVASSLSRITATGSPVTGWLPGDAVRNSGRIHSVAKLLTQERNDWIAALKRTSSQPVGSEIGFGSVSSAPETESILSVDRNSP